RHWQPVAGTRCHRAVDSPADAGRPVSLGTGAGIARRADRYVCRAAVRRGVPPVRRLGTPLDGCPLGAGVTRVGPHSAGHARGAGGSGMNELDVPWIELALLVPLVGSLWVHFVPTPRRARRHAIV